MASSNMRGYTSEDDERDRYRGRDDGGNEPVEMGQVVLLRQTEKAILVETAKGREVWLPMLAVHDDSEIFGVDNDGHKQGGGEVGKLVLKRWFVRAQVWER